MIPIYKLSFRHCQKVPISVFPCKLLLCKSRTLFDKFSFCRRIRIPVVFVLFPKIEFQLFICQSAVAVRIQKVPEIQFIIVPCQA